MSQRAQNMRAARVALLLVFGAVVWAACSDSPAGGEQPGRGNGGSAAGTGGGGGSATSGSAGQGGSAGGPGGGAGAGQGGEAGPSGTAGSAGSAPSQGGEVGIGGEAVAGAAGEGGAQPCNPGTTCHVNGDCGANETCHGDANTKLCVLDYRYCDAGQPCLRRSAGCVDNRCTPPLPRGAPCTSSAQCAGYCGSSHTCEDTKVCCDILHPEECGEGYVCAWRGLSECSGYTCVPAIAGENEQCTDVACVSGTVCVDPDVGPYATCLGGQQAVGEPCSVYDPSSPYKDTIINDCKAGLYCAPPASCKKKPAVGESCAGADAAGGAVKCLDGAYCGSDKICHKSDGQDCTTLPCQAGYRCALAAADGRCATIGSSCN